MNWRELVERPEWFELAACRGMNPELFFPARGESVAQTKAVCRECDVQAECLAYAMNTGEHHGMWGGFSERERRRLRAGQSARQERPIEHGTEGGARAHYRRREPLCEPCRQAWNAAINEDRAERSARSTTA